MPISSELIEKLNHPLQADKALFELASHYIHQQGVDIDEVIRAHQTIPFVSALPSERAAVCLTRVSMASRMLPEIRTMIDTYLLSEGLVVGEEKIMEYFRTLSLETTEMTAATFSIFHSLLAEMDKLTREWNMPRRELQATLSRLGTETAAYLILNSQDLFIRKLAKTNLVYFSLIEMLSLGVRTNAYQHTFVNPENVRPELLKNTDVIMALVSVEHDDGLKGALAFGSVEVEEIIPSGVPGLNFLRLT